MANETNDEVTGTNDEVVETARPDLIWDDEVPGLCLRVYGDGAKLFIFVYRINGQQRFIRIGKTPVWSLEGARIRAEELRSMIDEGRDPRPRKDRERGEMIPPVEDLLRYIAEHVRRKA
jgi:hypothetical protein